MWLSQFRNQLADGVSIRADRALRVVEEILHLEAVGFVKRACEQIVTIPGTGLVQSLNVAASAAILLHALSRQ